MKKEKTRQEIATSLEKEYLNKVVVIPGLDQHFNPHFIAGKINQIAFEQIKGDCVSLAINNRRYVFPLDLFKKNIKLL